MLNTQTLRPARSLTEDRAVKNQIEEAYRSGLITWREALAAATKVNWK